MTEPGRPPSRELYNAGATWPHIYVWPRLQTASLEMDLHHQRPPHAHTRACTHTHTHTHKHDSHPPGQLPLHEKKALISCSECTETFDVQWKLNRHARKHKQATLPCDCVVHAKDGLGLPRVCGKTFKDTQALERHKRSEHQVGK
jgi:hypothetical protein